jgi:hypothetical protein
MGKLIPQLISILTPNPKKKERRDFTHKVREEVIRRQKGKCTDCGMRINRWERDFDHKNGDKSNNHISNCRALHTKCHRKRHAEMRNRKPNKLRWLIFMPKRNTKY